MASSSEGDHLFDKDEPDRVVQLTMDDLTLRWHSDEFVQGVLPTGFEHVNWDRQIVASGGRAALDIGTRFVSEGAPLKVELKDERGTRIATLTETKSGAPLQVHQNHARVEVPPRLTKKAEGELSATAILPDHGLRQPSSRKLRVGPRVVVRAVKFLKETERQEVKSIRAGQPVRLQAQTNASPKGALPEGELVIFRLFLMDPATERKADEEVAKLHARTTGPAGKRGAEAVWTPTVEQIAQIEDAKRSREAFPSQRQLDERAKETGRPAQQYAAPTLFAQAEVWGALGTSLDERGSGSLKVRDRLDVQIVAAGSEAPLSQAKVEVELPDGSTRTGTLDAEGRARLTEVPPGLSYLTVQRPPDGWPPLVEGKTESEEADAPSTDQDRPTVEAFVPSDAGKGAPAETAEGVLTGTSTRVVVWPPHLKLHLRRALLGDARGLQGAAFRLESADGSNALAEGTLPEKGEDCPLLVGLPKGGSEKVKLVVWPFGEGAQEGLPCAWLLEAGVLEPVTGDGSSGNGGNSGGGNRGAPEKAEGALKGAQQRLRNLGYPNVDPTGEDDPASRHALGHLQARCAHESSGRLDTTTALFVEALHDEPT